MGRNSSKDGKKPEQNQMKNQGVSPPDIQGGFCHSFSLEKQAGGSLFPLVNSLYPSWTHSLPLVGSLPTCELTLSPCGVPIISNHVPPPGASDLTRGLAPEVLSRCQSVSRCEALAVGMSPLWNRLGPSEFALFGSQTPWLCPLRAPAGLAQELVLGPSTLGTALAATPNGLSRALAQDP